METRKINGELSDFNRKSEQESDLIHQKLDELIVLLKASEIDSQIRQQLHQKLTEAINSSVDKHLTNALVPFEKKEESIQNDLDQFLFINDLDRKLQYKTTVFQVVNKSVKVVIALLLILLGFGMIIMPAPAYFEMFTLFYLNPDDGVTIMDVISLIVVFAGVYILINLLMRPDRKK